MPELAEVHLAATDLHDLVAGCTVTEVHLCEWYLRGRVEKNPAADLRPLIGWSFSGVRRVGKALLFSLENPPLGSRYLASRLGMSGQWVWKPHDVDFRAIKHWVAALSLSLPQGKVWLVYSDTRHFGTLEVAEQIQDLRSIAIYGPEIMSSQFTLEWVAFVCAKKRIPIKALLLDQSHFAGVGNWVASEALYVAHIHPHTLARDLNREAVARLFHAIHLVVANGIKHGGASFRTWKHGDESKGAAQEHFMVYGRDGKPCKECGTPVVKTLIHKRSTFHCPTCQSPTWEPPKPVDEQFVANIERMMNVEK